MGQFNKLQNMKLTFKPFLIVLTLLTLSCSSQNNELEIIKESISQTAVNFWIPTHPQNLGQEDKLALHENSRNIIEDKPTDLTSDVELLWLVPQGYVTKYILRYGTDKDYLDSVTEISKDDLSPIMHPKFGKVYKYILSNVPANTTIYYSLQAGNELGLSEPTPVASEVSNGL